MTHKIKFSFFALLFAFTQAFAQSPSMINYQGVALNSAGSAIANQTISIRASVHQTTANGTILYSEERSVPTDASGLFNFQIGSSGATATTGTWGAINWDNDNKFLEIEMDPAGGTNFLAMGTQQLVSVPYAQYANKAGALIPTATINPNQINAGGATTNQVLKYNGTNWVPGNDVSAFALPYTATDANPTSFSITNSSANGNAMAATTNSSNAIGVKGTANHATGTGVFGTSTDGFGVRGYGNDAGSVGVQGQTLFGTGVKAISTSSSGKALEVSGNVKIAGGNTNPSQGAVLTSLDASGNAVWENNNIGFCVRKTENTALPPTQDVKIEFSQENYDLQSNFVPYAGSATSNSSKFTAPKSGIYHFSSGMTLQISSATNNFARCFIILVINGNHFLELEGSGQNTAFSSWVPLSLSTSVHLNANDQVWIEVRQNNSSNTSEGLSNNLSDGHFTGNLLFAD